MLSIIINQKSLPKPKASMKLVSDPSVQDVFLQYPDHIRPIMQELRDLLISRAKSIDGVDRLVESLKWGEPSYRSNHGSTIRMDWKQRSPKYYALYFQCTTSLISTFKTIYGADLKFEGKRAILLDLEEDIPEALLGPCLSMALNYHRIKHLPLLGA
jgi:hypothetical protein